MFATNPSFNDIPNILEKLNKVGIGDMGEWKSDMEGGYFSTTPYYELENNISASNKISMSALSKNFKYVEKIFIGLHINTPQKENEAVRVFENSLKKILRIIGEKYTNEISSKIKRKENFETSLNKYKVNFQLLQSKISTYEVTITIK